MYLFPTVCFFAVAVVVVVVVAVCSLLLYVVLDDCMHMDVDQSREHI